MASQSWPNAGHNSGEVSNAEWEVMTFGGLGAGLVGHQAPPPPV